MTSRFGLPVFPIDDALSLEPGFSDETLEWLLEHGTTIATLKLLLRDLQVPV